MGRFSMFATAILAGKRAGARRPSSIIRGGFALLTAGLLILIPLVPRATSGWYPVRPLVIAGLGQLRRGSFGLSFGLAFAGAIVLATLSITFTSMAASSTVLSPAQQEQVAQALEQDAEVMSNTELKSDRCSCRWPCWSSKPSTVLGRGLSLRPV